MIILNNKKKCTNQALDSVEAELRFTTPQDDQPVVYLVDYESTTIKLEPRLIRISNGRVSQESFSIETNGFELIRYASELADVRDSDAVKRIFQPEAEKLLKRLTGASRVLMFHHLARDMREAPSTENLGAATNVHVDHDQATYEYNIRKCLPSGEADALLNRRWAAYNIWKPIAPVEKLPLAVCDARTIFKENLIPTGVGTRPGEPLLPRTGLGITYSPEQRWFYFPNMTSDEALVLKMWDTDRARAQWAAHSAFVDPTSKSDAKPRVSLDARFIAFY